MDSFKEFRSKIEKFSRKNLQDFCVQIICELMRKDSELGETRQQIKLQEQAIESYRVKYATISKQARDLEIVKTRLIQDMRNRENNGLNPNDATPVKITRSVGLQVALQTQTPRRFVPNAHLLNTPNTTINQTPPKPSPQTPIQNVTPQNEQRRKPIRQSVPIKPTNPTPPAKPVLNKPTPPAPVTPKPPPVPQKTIKTILPVRTPEAKEQSSLLNKALQKPTTPTTPASTTPKKTAEPKGVIDLTDEDENKVEANKVPTVPAVPPGLSSGIRIVTSQAITNPPTISTASLVASTTQGPRLTYLVANTSNGQQGQPIILQNIATMPPRAGAPVRQVMFRPITSTTRKYFYMIPAKKLSRNFAHT